jgi:hypothetical protein
MDNRPKGIMPRRTLAKVYFSLGGAGVAFAFAGISRIGTCPAPFPWVTEQPNRWCRIPDGVFGAGFLACFMLALGLLVADSFARGTFDD